MRDLVHRRAWLAVGRLGISLAIVLSLVPLPAAPIEIEQGDKLGHFAAYFALTLWYAQLVATPRELAWRALAFALMGLALEGLQSLTGWRHGNDPLDALANVAGTAGGFVIGLTPARGLLVALEQRLRQRPAPR
ncbi:MAG TPA: hypothetical protein VND91_01875 [Candidatus Saccharimonadia bacterium]|nr:hypothetical protein [Candidatus Saccharimonadia bacterium]